MAKMPVTRRTLAIILVSVAVFALLAWWLWPSNNAASEQVATVHHDPLAMTEQQMRRAGIMLVSARTEAAMPIGSVPATVVLPPDARAAVAVPYTGILQRVLVVPGQTVARGQAVAIMISPEAVRIGAERARAQARADVAGASAARNAQLAREGIIALARADEARAIAREAAVSANEQASLLAIGGATAGGSITLRAPIAGRVASITAQPGAALDGMVAPMLIEATDRMQLELQVPERLAGSVQVGQFVQLASGQRGRIIGTGVSLDPMSRSVAVRASLIGTAGLVVGQSVETIIEGTGASGVSIPVTALTRSGERDAVFVFDGRRMRLQPVTVIARSGQLAFVSDGLSVGDRVAASGVTELRAASGQ